MSTSSHYHRTLFEKSPNAIAYHRLLRNDTGAVCDSLLLHVNPALEVLFQRAASELVGRRFLEVYPHHSERTQRFISSLDEASRSQTEITLSFHAHFIGKWLRTTLFALDADTVASISTDITQEVMQEIEFKGFLQSNLDMLAVGDKNGRFIRVNQEFENILGYRFNPIILEYSLYFKPYCSIALYFITMSRQTVGHWSAKPCCEIH
mgnify:CR=1 FL=1